MVSRVKDYIRSAETKRIIFSIIILALYSVVLCFFNSNIEKTPLINSEGKTYAKAEVVEIINENAAEAGERAGSQKVLLEIKSGQYKGERLEAYSTDGYLYGADSEVGMTVMAVISESNGEKVVSVGGVYRGGAVVLILVLFLLSIWIIGGRKGLLAVISLVFTLVTIVGLFLPMIYRGVSPFLSAVISCVITTAVCMPLIGGMSKKTAASIFASVAGVIIAGILAFLFGKLTDVSGYNVSEIDELMFIAANTDIQVGELLFAGILIASMGAVMDVAMSVVTAVEEIHIKNPEMSARELFVSGMKVGNDTMGTMSNTLILAFVGSSINTLVTIYAYDYPMMYTMNLYSTCIEIIRGISGSMGVVFAVPIAAAASSFLYGARRRSDMQAEIV
ncbi:MAG TPA: YibE/F family protein [Candidatus Ornithomonoglobus merdipullorum]|uniref:YibE/F family protein n=1 Tax=Candidatus Ornithomonoglobus merdipullorum TaxID=2840895 RepID=A0A9D1MCT7_9FIRM|nr:YibE/F family protein [Candidatus Ornithomonoglobus merdipullorum]